MITGVIKDANTAMDNVEKFKDDFKEITNIMIDRIGASMGIPPHAIGHNRMIFAKTGGIAKEIKQSGVKVQGK